MTWELAVVLFGLAGTGCSIVFGYAAFARNGKKNTEDEAKNDATVLTEIGYIKGGIDDIKAEQREQRKTNLEVLTRLTAVEESAKQAHKRLDRLDGITDHQNEPD